MRTLFGLACTLVLSLPSCRSAQPPEEGVVHSAALPASTLPAGTLIGGSVVPQPSVRFAEVQARPAEFFERTLLVEATVLAVCAKKGCWMQVEDAGRTALVRWEEGCGGAYAFPTDVIGKRVLIQGSVYQKDLAEEDAQHMEEEAGRALTLERAGYELNASALIVLDA